MTEVQLPARPPLGLIPRGIWGREYATGRVEWFAMRSYLITAHRWHIARARFYRITGNNGAAAMHLNGAARVRRYISRPLPSRSVLPLLRAS